MLLMVDLASWVMVSFWGARRLDHAAPMGHDGHASVFWI